MSLPEQICLADICFRLYSQAAEARGEGANGVRRFEISDVFLQEHIVEISVGRWFWLFAR
jgi:hypothetical protein